MVIQMADFERFIADCSGSGIRGYCFFMTTEECLFDYWEGHYDFSSGFSENLLEARIFNETCEYKLMRTDIGRTFSVRVITAEDEKEGKRYGDYYDQKQFLDIDNKNSRESFRQNKCVSTTGGRGQYKLPIDEFDENAQLTVRYYIDHYPETGQARIFDWRIVSIDGGGV